MILPICCLEAQGYATLFLELVVKHIFYLFLLLGITSSLFAMTGKVEKSFPNQVEISWEAQPGAVHYDVYLDNQPLARLGSTQLHFRVGSNLKPLKSRHDYLVIVACRDEQDTTLAYVQMPIITTSWSGSYSWKNSTEDDNNGRCKSLHFVLEDTNDGLVILSELPNGVGLRQVFPLDITDRWIEYASDEAETYRSNAMIFNCTSFSPDCYKGISMLQDEFGAVAKVSTKALGFTITTSSQYELQVDSHDKRVVLFRTNGSGIAATGIFKNPESGSKGKFALMEDFAI